MLQHHLCNVLDTTSDRHYRTLGTSGVPSYSIETTLAAMSPPQLRQIRSTLLLEIDRLYLTTILAVGTFVALVLILVVGPAPLEETIESGNALWEVFSPLIAATITAVAVVTTLNQLVLSQELGTLGDQHERMQGAMRFRSEIRPWLSMTVVPREPAAFLQCMMDAIVREAELLEENYSSNQATGKRDAASVRRIKREAIAVRERLAGTQFGTFAVINSAMHFDYTRAIHDIELFAVSLENSDQHSRESTVGLLTLLEAYGPVREHFKTLYFQWELVNLSRGMLYGSLPAILVAIGIMFGVTPAAVPGSMFGIPFLVVVLAASITLVLVPFFLLISYVIRIATVAKRTLAIGPFELQ